MSFATNSSIAAKLKKKFSQFWSELRAFQQNSTEKQVYASLKDDL